MDSPEGPVDASLRARGIRKAAYFVSVSTMASIASLLNMIPANRVYSAHLVPKQEFINKSIPSQVGKIVTPFFRQASI